MVRLHVTVLVTNDVGDGGPKSSVYDKEDSIRYTIFLNDSYWV